LDPAGAPVIVVDTNIICYRYIPSPHSADVDRLVTKDSDWIVPLLWRSEFRNALAGALRQRLITLNTAMETATEAESHLDNREFAVSSKDILRLIDRSKCSAYECEFVALAQETNVQLLTMDRQILGEFPKIAVSLQHFLRA
jgi:predicted nucleic acid-binding protein